MCGVGTSQAEVSGSSGGMSSFCLPDVSLLDSGLDAPGYWLAGPDLIQWLLLVVAHALHQ